MAISATSALDSTNLKLFTISAEISHSAELID